MRQYYNREYEAKPPSPTSRNYSPYPSSSKRYSNTPSYRNDYSRSQHYSADLSEPVPSLDVTDNTSSSSYELSGERKNKAMSDIGSPDCVAGLNVRNLANRYGNIGVASQRSWSVTRSPTKIYRSPNRQGSNSEGSNHVETVNHASVIEKQKVIRTTKPLSGSPIGSNHKNSLVKSESKSENNDEFQGQNFRNGLSRQMRNNLGSNNDAVFQSATPLSTFYDSSDNNTVESSVKNESKRSQYLQSVKWNQPNVRSKSPVVVSKTSPAGRGNHQASDTIVQPSRDPKAVKQCDKEKANANNLSSGKNKGLSIGDEEESSKDTMGNIKIGTNKENIALEDDDDDEENRSVLQKAQFWRNQFTNTNNQKISTSRSRSRSKPKRLSPSRNPQDLDRNQAIEMQESNLVVDNKLCSSPDGKSDRYFSSINTASNYHFSRHIGYMQTKSRPQQLKDSPKTPKAGNTHVMVAAKRNTDVEEESKDQSKVPAPSSLSNRTPKTINDDNEAKNLFVRPDSNTAMNNNKGARDSQNNNLHHNLQSHHKLRNENDVKDSVKRSTSRQRTRLSSRYGTNENNNVTISKTFSQEEDVYTQFDDNPFSARNNAAHLDNNQMQLAPATRNRTKHAFQVNAVAQQQSETSKNIEMTTKGKISSSPNPFHENIRKFNTGKELSLPSPKAQVVEAIKCKKEKQNFQIPQFEKGNKLSGTQDTEGYRLKWSEIQKENTKLDKRDQTLEPMKLDSHMEGEDGTLADYSLTLSVSEAKALLWDTNEKLIPQCSPPVKDPHIPDNRHMFKDSFKESNDPLKTPFKSKLFTRAAEAAQTIHKTYSMDAGHQSSNPSNASPYIRHASSFSPNSRNEKRFNHQNRVITDSRLNRHQSIEEHPRLPRHSNPQSGSHMNILPKDNQGIPNKQETYEVKSKSHMTSNRPTNEGNDNRMYSKSQRQSNASSIAKLVEKLAAVKRDNPSAALRAIDSILHSERMGLGIIQEDELLSNSQQENIPQSHQDENDDIVDIPADEDGEDEILSEKEDGSSCDSDYDSDESSVSAITDPTYQSFFGDTSSVISYSTVSRNGKKRQFSYHVAKEKGISQLHLPCPAARGSSSLHRNRKNNGMRQSSTIHQKNSTLDDSFQSDGHDSSTKMVSPPIVARKISENSQANQTQYASIMSSISASSKLIHGGGRSKNNRGLLQAISTWDENSNEDSTEEPGTNKISSGKAPASPGCSERIKKIASTINSNKDTNESEQLKRRFMFPAQQALHNKRAPKVPPLQHQNEEYVNDQKRRSATELPANVASAFDDVNISFGSENIFSPEDEPSFLSPLAKKFSKVQKIYNYQ